MKDKIYKSYKDHEDESCGKCQNTVIDNPIKCCMCVWNARNAEIQELKDKVEKLNKDNFSLSAGCCEYLIGDERGHETCKFRKKLKELGERE